MRLRFRVLGPLEVRDDNGVRTLGGPTQQTILAVLIAYANEPVSTDRLVDEVWGDETGKDPVHRLRVHVSALRKIVEPDHDGTGNWSVIETVGDAYRLNTAGHDLDTGRAEELSVDGVRSHAAGDLQASHAALEEALGLWAGRPYEGLDSSSVIPAERSRLEELELQTLVAYFDCSMDLGLHDRVTPRLREAIGQFPFNERLRSQLMLSLHRSGRSTEALEVYRQFAIMLGDELGLEPGEQIRALEEQILLHDPSLTPAPPASRTNLPAPADIFIGRAGDIDSAMEVLGRARVLTLTGPGGVGKTRLALEIGRRAADRYGDGTWLVELAPIHDPDLIAPTVARVLDVDTQPARPALETLADRLAKKEMLLILDNCEHLIERVAELVSFIVPACPGVTVLATSRESISVTGETVQRVQPLGPDESAELFMRRAESRDVSFEVAPGEQERLSAIVTKLDGLPLAIELAAVRTEVLTLGQIEDGLVDRFGLLTGGSRTADLRQQTLEAAIDWSHDLLDDEEQKMLRRLAVFRGTFGLDAVQAMHGELGGTSADALEVLSGLVSKSLVSTVRAGAEIRYELLETIRQYARSKLAAAGEAERLVLWHRSFYRYLLREANPELTTADQLEWVGRLERDHDNLRAMLERAFDAGDWGTCVEIAADIVLFWFLHSHYLEAETWLGRIQDHLETAHPSTRARLLIGSARLMRFDSGAAARAQLHEALRYCEQVGSPELTGWAWTYLSLVDVMEKQFAEAQTEAETAVELFQRAGTLGGTGFAMWMRAAAVGMRSRFADGRVDDESVAIIESLLEPARAVGERNFLGHIGYALGVHLIDVGELDRAADQLRYSITALVELGNRACAAHNIDQVARLQVRRGKPLDAWVILASTRGIRDRLGFAGHPIEVQLWDEAMSEARNVLLPDGLEDEWAHGYDMSFAQAAEHALGLLG